MPYSYFCVENDCTQEITHVQDIVRTTHDKTPAAPPKPVTPVQVPDHQVVEGDPIKFSADWSNNNAMQLPPEPTTNDDNETIFRAVEQMPKLIGGGCDKEALPCC